ncbi:N-acetylglucosamine-6-phosphate deacetylase [Niabella drilacis]|uniref:N-acetylglucosamine-6-phosphate deacetylase n=1 Tax=Niabella drilacis (strain DSM 25811 / CCM 8410 / CCUG 62505 / LMG 26954 / E90) TaxID=1285928 RepID=A0A1G6NXQ9_NIADE|nr:N-acetylglucosamine-6-phosphate deacetylase [Niabella drilacis]SDC72017.1 N-acetylglucosamine-6-phosphate deacetylase [Niabella drilacis]
MKRYLKIINARILTPHRVIKEGTLVAAEGRIVYVGTQNPEIAAAEEMDAQGNYLAPGFIDLHVHGGGGYDFMDGTEEAFLKIAETHARYGTTALYPTTLTSEKQRLLDTLDVFESVQQRNHCGARFMGMHLEGPYFAMSQRGAQDPRYIRNPDPAEYKAVIGYSPSVKRWSAAPELEGALELGRYLRSKNVLPAIAHTDAVYEEVVNAFENGYTLATHFYSGMSGVSRRNGYRYAGVVESGYLIDAMDVEVIADGIHLPAPLLQLIVKIKGADHIALITDAMRAAGMPEGASILGGRENGLPVIVENGVAWLPDRSAFAGSVATASSLVRNMVELAAVPLADAVRMITVTPARIMGIDQQKGALVAGKDADLVLFDAGINVCKTIIGGRVVYSRDEVNAG